MQPPKGYYPGEFAFGTSKQSFVATGEFRPPKRGEYYLSGAITAAYRAGSDFSMMYWIAKPVVLKTCECCQGTGKVVQ